MRIVSKYYGNTLFVYVVECILSVNCLEIVIISIKMVVERLEALITKKKPMAVLRMIPEANVAALIGSRSIQINGFVVECMLMYY